MMPSQDLVEFVRRREALRLVAFKPTPKDVWTIGYGRTRGVYQGMIITPYEAEEFLYDDLGQSAEDVDATVRFPLNQHQFDALVSLLYNIGVTSWKKSLARELLNEGNIDRFDRETFSAQYGWTKQGGVIVPGLVNRRQMERDIFFKAIYAK